MGVRKATQRGRHQIPLWVSITKHFSSALLAELAAFDSFVLEATDHLAGLSLFGFPSQAGSLLLARLAVASIVPPLGGAVLMKYVSHVLSKMHTLCCKMIKTLVDRV